MLFISGQVQEVMDEIGNPGIPLSVISKAAEMQLHYTVDKVILGNRWLRKATGIQPKFPYMVDTFERRYTLCHCGVCAITSNISFVIGYVYIYIYICIF